MILTSHRHQFLVKDVNRRRRKKHRRVPKSRLQELQDKVDEDTQQIIKMKSEKLRRQKTTKDKKK